MRNRFAVVTTFLTVVLVACGPATRAGGGDGDGATADPDGGDGPCTLGEIRCSGLTVTTCDGTTFVPGETCSEGCAAGIGCVACTPGTGTCLDDTHSRTCRSDGSGFDDLECDPALGSTCDPASGVCSGACAPQRLGLAYIGCEYYPTVLANAISSDFDFAVAIGNTSNDVATVTIDGGALGAARTVMVAAQSVRVERLPWVAALKYCMEVGGPGTCLHASQFSALAGGGAYRLRSNVPVTVYQFNPLDYVMGNGMYSYSNDAALLLPVNAWGQEFRAAAWPAQFGTHPSLMAITAAHDATSVTITSKASTNAEAGAPALAIGAPVTVVLGRGDVLELGSGGDFSGSLVVSDKPVQLVGAAYCGNVPDIGVGACDHMEESILPISTLADRYAVVAPRTGAHPTGRAQVVRIVATEPGTSLSYDPPQAGAPASLAAAGDFADVPAGAASYVVTASAKVLVAQYMIGATDDGEGDPAMSIAVPIEQYRSTYVFHAPTNYDANYVDIVAPDGAAVTLDGAPVTGFVAIGASGYAVARVALGDGPLADGNHLITGSAAFGISVYGYGFYTAYWYPGGMDLERIIID